jgi:hypothetical protein
MHNQDLVTYALHLVLHSLLRGFLSLFQPSLLCHRFASGQPFESTQALDDHGGSDIYPAQCYRVAPCQQKLLGLADDL